MHTVVDGFLSGDAHNVQSPQLKCPEKAIELLCIDA